MTSKHAFSLLYVSQHWLRALACTAICVLLVGCGFQLKGVEPLPFTTIYTNISQNSEFGAGLRRAIEASSPSTRFIDEPAAAQVKLIQLTDQQSLRELSLDAQGQVEEYELNLVFIFQLTDAKGRLVLPPTTLRQTREVPYDASVVQAKQSEIDMVFKQMRAALIDGIVRRLSAPAVTAAFSDPSELPVDENPAPDTPIRESKSPTPWSQPGTLPGTGF